MERNSGDMKKRKNYVQPKLELLIVEMESGIAASSAKISPGDQSTPNSPGMSDWTDKGDAGGGTNSFDL